MVGRFRGVLLCLYVLGVMKMGIIAPTAGFEPIPHAFQSHVLTITLPRLPDIITLSTPHLSMWLLEVRAEFYTRPFGIVNILNGFRP